MFETQRKSLVELTIDEEQVEKMITDKIWLTMMGLDAQSQRTAAQTEQIKSYFRLGMRFIRMDSSFWIGQCRFETEEYGSALNWFRQLQDSSDKWSDLASYNLARTQEALFKFDKAIEIYRKTESNQKFGNIIRARLIQRWNLGDKTATQPE